MPGQAGVREESVPTLASTTPHGRVGPPGLPASVHLTPDAEPGWPGVGAGTALAWPRPAGKTRPCQSLAHLPRDAAGPGSSLSLGSKVDAARRHRRPRLVPGTHTRATMMVFPDARALRGPAIFLAGGKTVSRRPSGPCLTDLCCEHAEKAAPSGLCQSSANIFSLSQRCGGARDSSRTVLLFSP